MKNTIEKAVIVLMTVFISIILLAGCSKNDSIDEEFADDSDTKTGIRMEKIRVWTDNAHEKDLRLQQIEEFNNTIGKEKGITIEYTVYGSNYQDTIKKAAQRGEAPELFRPTGAFLLDFVNSGYMVPISNLPGGDALIEQYEGSLVNNQHVFDGKTYALPYNLTTYKFIINEDLFEKAGIKEYPKTWEEVREAARLITNAGDGKEFGWVLGLKSNWMMSTYLTRPNGTNVGHVGFNHETMKFEFSAFAPVIEAVKGMIDDGSVFPGFEGLDADAARAQFAEGRIGMIPGASFDTGVYNEQFPAKCNWTVINIPSFTKDGSPYKEFADATSLLGVGTAALDKAEKTFEVLKFFYSDENAAQMYEHSLYIPFRQEAIDLATSEPVQKGFADFANVPNKVIMLPFPDTHITVKGDAYRETIMKIFAGEYDNKDVDTVLTDMDRRYNKALYELSPQELEAFKQTAEILEGFKAR
ncbi:extracellular solute-binding protein [Mobilitalea sibirica]|uniref:Extracellular solute-binding protein n=1 Tax=Mobilitalea sibirica TaxID=1462919 RepID=A0A8J7H5G0_9FIRM|nr:extracellular solute-binding protein [Mobilitalea sibirica]MBH1940111.1 extracellular solute-binding protein [Mobilitalea sibirica]